MRAIDTNILARFLVQDDPGQTVVARRIMAEGVFIPLTVLLETAWLLRSRYGMDRATLTHVLGTVANMADVEIPDAALVQWAIDRVAQGGDIADMLHLVAARRAAGFATFDRAIAAAAGPDSPVAIETL